jgi:hypothetical protein
MLKVKIIAQIRCSNSKSSRVRREKGRQVLKRTPEAYHRRHFISLLPLLKTYLTFLQFTNIFIH